LSNVLKGAPQGSNRSGCGLALIEVEERSRPTLIDQRSESPEFPVTHFVLKPQHVEPALEDSAEARLLPAVDEAARIGLLVVGQRDFDGHGRLLPP
jgi:hypothetical protein